MRLAQGNAEALPFRDAGFDVVFSLHLVEHLYHPERGAGEFSRCLKQGGVLIVATPNPGGIGARVMGRKWRGWSQNHVSLKRPEEWAKLLHECGFVPLLERTTLLSGIPAFRKFPLALLNWGLLLLFGSFPWRQGEAYIAVWRKE
ncbi:MAG: methyltransferase domain-containing protein [Anaerolineae bacterium]|nr:methyltransferase domain-containing protein [Anaerolineae bacterium]